MVGDWPGRSGNWPSSNALRGLMLTHSSRHDEVQDHGLVNGTWGPQSEEHGVLWSAEHGVLGQRNMGSLVKEHGLLSQQMMGPQSEEHGVLGQRNMESSVRGTWGPWSAEHGVLTAEHGLLSQRNMGSFSGTWVLGQSWCS